MASSGGNNIAALLDDTSNSLHKGAATTFKAMSEDLSTMEINAEGSIHEDLLSDEDGDCNSNSNVIRDNAEVKKSLETSLVLAEDPPTPAMVHQESKNEEFDWSEAHLQLWNTFTFYALQGDPLQLNYLRSYEFTKFVQDCGVLRNDATSLAGEETWAVQMRKEGLHTAQLRLADINVLVSAETSKQTKHAQNRKTSDKMHKSSSRKITFPTFLNIILKLSQKVFPRQPSPELSLRCFVEMILPHAHCRKPKSVAHMLEDTEVRRVLQRFESAFAQIFRFYSSAAERSSSSEGFGNATKALWADTKSSVSGIPQGNRMKEELSYEGFLEFAKDFGLGTSALLSTQTLGEAFLASIDYRAFHERVPKMLFEEFVDSLLHCASSIGRFAHRKATIADRLKHLYLVMWKAVTKRNRIVAAIEYHHLRTTYAADLLAGVALFNNKFTEMWAEDNHRDYLEPVPEPETHAFDLIQRLRGASV